MYTTSKTQPKLTRLSTLLAAALLFAGHSQAQLDESWTVTVNGQTVPVDPDGKYFIGNISAPDQFGTAGPGSRPDLLSDDFLRVIATTERNGETLYAFSPYFQIARRQTFVVGDLTVTSTPPVSPVSLTVTIAEPILRGAVGQTTQAATVATLNDGAIRDVTPRSSWTVYRTSNPGVVTVGQDGTVTSVGRGTAFVTAVNDNVSAVARVTVVPNDPGTTVEGLVQFSDGSIAAGADLSIPAFGLTGQSRNDGTFSIPQVPSTAGNFIAIARFDDPVLGVLSAFSSELTPNPGGTTNAGVLTLTEHACGFDPALGTPLNLGDDSATLITFSQGFVFPYFGTDRTEMWVSSNGNVQFGGPGDRTWNPSIPSGVVDGVARISPAFFDLNPSSGGDVYVNQLIDRVVVTWFEIPEFSSPLVNTMQLTLSADGSVTFAYDGLGSAAGGRQIPVACSPGGAPAVHFEDFTAGGVSSSAGEAPIQNFNPNDRFDLDMGCVTWTPNAAGGFDASYRPFVSATRDGTAIARLVDKLGRPLLSTSLEVTSSSDPSFRRRLHTDELGCCLISGLPCPGTVMFRDLASGTAGCATLRATWDRPVVDVAPRPIGRKR